MTLKRLEGFTSSAATNTPGPGGLGGGKPSGEVLSDLRSLYHAAGKAGGAVREFLEAQGYKGLAAAARAWEKQLSAES